MYRNSFTTISIISRKISKTFLIGIPDLEMDLMEDYSEAEQRQEAFFQMMEDDPSIFDGMFWDNVLQTLLDIWSSTSSWALWIKEKLFILLIHLAASIFSGAIFLLVIGIYLLIFGPLQVKTVAKIIITFVLGITFVKESTEMAASTIAGITLISYFFVVKASKFHVLMGEDPDGREWERFVRLDFNFWYDGQRALWIKLAKNKRLIGFS